jgi:hypothetical protein
MLAVISVLVGVGTLVPRGSLDTELSDGRLIRFACSATSSGPAGHREKPFWLLAGTSMALGSATW